MVKLHLDRRAVRRRWRRDNGIMDEHSNLNEQLPSRFVVGIDLGTTNSAVCYVDTAQQPWRVRAFAIPQLVDAGQIEAWDTLPSFHYQPLASEATGQALRLPWQAQPHPYVVGMMAREQGPLRPGRLIASAKSWLCHSGVDRTAELLPWHGAADADRLSPVQASSRYLQHLREAWDASWPQYPLAEQDVVLTLPASFDEVARELTVQAAALAGLPRVVLIEEPQAAFYAWIDHHRDDWEAVAPGQKILVCDIGGGTSDFTLIRVAAAGEGGASSSTAWPSAITDPGRRQPGPGPGQASGTETGRAAPLGRNSGLCWYAAAAVKETLLERSRRSDSRSTCRAPARV